MIKVYVSSCGFALICERDENRLVAENILNLIVRNLQEYCQIILQPSEAILKADKVTTILHHFLPEGQLLFMNNRFLRHVEKELEQVMNAKWDDLAIYCINFVNIYLLYISEHKIITCYSCCNNTNEKMTKLQQCPSKV